MTSQLAFEQQLQAELEHLYQITVPGPPVLAARADLISRVQRIIANRYGAQYRVEGFGSTSYGVSGITSDLDLAIVDQDRPNGFAPDVNMDYLPNIYNPGNVARTLNAAGFKDVIPIRAAVPIVKFTDPRWDIQCDINTNEQFGIRNSRLLKAYLDITPIGRPLAVAVKLWAKRRGLNDPAGNDGPTTLSSYSITLLLLAYLQTIQHLPNLQSPALIAHAGTAPSHLWARPKVSRPKRFNAKRAKRAAARNDAVEKEPEAPPPPRVCCDTTFVTQPPDDAWAQADVGMAAALLGFFDFYAAEEGAGFAYASQIVSVAEGGVVPRTEGFKEPPPPSPPPAKKRREKGKKKKADGDGAVSAQGQAAAADGTAGDGEPQTSASQSLAKESGSSTPSGDGQHSAGGEIARPTDLPALGVPDISQGEVDEGEAEQNPEDDGVEDVGDKQPIAWKEHLYVIQDPFIRARNTSQNIRPSTARHIISEFGRARDLLLADHTFDEVCARSTVPINGEGPIRKRPRPQQPKRAPGTDGRGLSRPSNKGLEQVMDRMPLDEARASQPMDILKQLQRPPATSGGVRLSYPNGKPLELSSQRVPIGYNGSPQHPVRPAAGPEALGEAAHPLYLAAQSITTPQCLITGIVDLISEPALYVDLSRFGKIRQLSMVRKEGIAYVEFDALDSAKRAIVASLPRYAGGNGSVKVKTENGTQVKVQIRSRTQALLSLPRAPQADVDGPTSAEGSNSRRKDHNARFTRANQV